MRTSKDWTWSPHEYATAAGHYSTTLRTAQVKWYHFSWMANANLKFLGRAAAKSRAAKAITVKGAAPYWLHAHRGGEVECALLRRVRHGGDGEGRFVGVGALAAAGVADDSAECCEKRLEAMPGGVVVQDALVDLAQGLSGSPGRRDGVAGLLRVAVLVAEEQCAPSLEQVPLDVVREHAQEDVRTHPAFQVVMHATAKGY